MILVLSAIESVKTIKLDSNGDQLKGEDPVVTQSDSHKCEGNNVSDNISTNTFYENLARCLEKVLLAKNLLLYSDSSARF